MKNISAQFYLRKINIILIRDFKKCENDEYIEHGLGGQRPENDADFEANPCYGSTLHFNAFIFTNFQMKLKFTLKLPDYSNSEWEM